MEPLQYGGSVEPLTVSQNVADQFATVPVWRLQCNGNMDRAQTINAWKDGMSPGREIVTYSLPKHYNSAVSIQKFRHLYEYEHGYER